MIPVSMALFIKNVDQDGLSIWMQRRFEAGALYNRWEFPGGKLEAGESALEAAVREVEEEVGVRAPASELKLFKRFSFQYDDRPHLQLFAFISSFDQLPTDKGEWRRFSYGQARSDERVDFMPANHQLMDELLEFFKEHYHAGLLEEVWAK